MVNNQRSISAVFSALADPTRRRILTVLSSQGERPVTAVAKSFRISLPAVSRHLRVLEQARLIQRRREGRIHMIRARAGGVDVARDWIDQFTSAWDFSFDKLEKLVTDESGKETS